MSLADTRYIIEIGQMLKKNSEQKVCHLFIRNAHFDHTGTYHCKYAHVDSVGDSASGYVLIYSKK